MSDDYEDDEINAEKIKDSVYIEIFEQQEIDDYGRAKFREEPIKRLLYKELLEINFQNVESKFSGKEKENTETSSLTLYKEDSLTSVDMNKLPSEFREGKIQSVQDFHNKVCQIEQVRAELERKRSVLGEQIREMEKWLAAKYRVICAFETYLGTHEEIVELIGEGKTSDKPIHFYQRVLFMDEEYGIVRLDKLVSMDYIEEKDFDYHDIHFFDEWICKNYQLFIPEERGIRMWRIKRKNKDYKDKWANMIENDRNMNCYFLIRNGERLYRIFSDVYSCDDTMFPTEEQTIKAGKPWYKERGFDEEEFEKNMRPWRYIILALQGILDRTDILGTDCQMKCNLLMGLYDSSKISLVRDAEWTNLIEDNSMPKFDDWLDQNRKNTNKGDRVLITHLYTNEYSSHKDDFGFISQHEMDWRRRWCDKPSKSLVYEVKDIKNFRNVTKYKILYFEDNRYYYDEPRKKRTACWLEHGEFINLSKCKIEDIMFYLKDRSERENYLRILPVMALALRYLKTKAFEREDYFKKWEN